MGTTLAIWKWATRGNAELARRVWESIAQEEPHAAIVRFDVAALEAAIERELREDDEPVFDIDRGDFAGQPCNWLVLDAGFGGAYRSLPRLLELAKAHKAVVYDADHGKLITPASALKVAAAAAMPTEPEELLADYRQILTGQVRPMLQELGFVGRGIAFRRDEGERVCGVRLPGEHLTLAILTVRFPALSALESRYRQFCLEQAVEGVAHVWAQEQLPSRPSRKPFWDADHRDTHGAKVTAALRQAIEAEFAKNRTLAEWTQAREQVAREYRASWTLAQAYWVLGRRDEARRLLRDEWTRLDELLKTKYHPPSRGDRVEVEFLQRFFDAEEAGTGLDCRGQPMASPSTPT